MLTRFSQQQKKHAGCSKEILQLIREGERKNKIYLFIHSSIHSLTSGWINMALQCF